MLITDIVAGLEPIIGSGDLELPEQRPWQEDPEQVVGVVRVVGEPVVVKISAAAGIGRTQVPWVLRERGIDVPWDESFMAARTSDTGQREAAAYSLFALRNVLPRELGRFAAGDETALVLEDVAAAPAPLRWPTERIEAALVAAASFHGPTAGRDYRWAPLRPSTRTTMADAGLFRAILLDASQRVPDIVTPTVLESRLATIDSISRWHPAKDVMPACLVHNDFRPHNVVFRESGEVVVLDWSLARVNTPQRDAVELLTWTLDAHTEVDELMHLLAVHWQALADNGLEVDPEVYARAAAAEFRAQSIEWMGVHLILDPPDLKRINRTVDHLVVLTSE